MRYSVRYNNHTQLFRISEVSGIQALEHSLGAKLLHYIWCHLTAQKQTTVIVTVCSPLDLPVLLRQTWMLLVKRNVFEFPRIIFFCSKSLVIVIQQKKRAIRSMEVILCRWQNLLPKRISYIFLNVCMRVPSSRIIINAFFSHGITYHMISIWGISRFCVK